MTPRHFLSFVLSASDGGTDERILCTDHQHDKHDKLSHLALAQGSLFTKYCISTLNDNPTEKWYFKNP
jgi:hypothetical protein